MPHPERLATIADKRKIVLVSGCSSGIGQALAIEFASRNKEYHVFASARNLDSIRCLPSSIERIQLDVTDEESTKRCVESVIAQVGRIDVLVNNAGVNTGTGPSVEVELDRYRSTFEANFFGLIRLTQHVAPHMMDRRQGHIIQIGSTVGLVPLPYAASYAASKAAVHSFSETLAMELKGFNVDVTVVAPGAIKSSIGEKNVKHIKLPGDSRYKNVEDMVQYRAIYSQVGRPAPSPTADFAREVVDRACPRQSSWSLVAWLWRTKPPAYVIAGSRSSLIKLLFYLPVWVRQALLGRAFQMGRVGKGKGKSA